MAERTDGIRPYGPGKFSTILDSLVWDMSLDGADDECGDSNIGIWYGRLNGPFSITADLTPAERKVVEASIGVILSENGHGFVTVDYYDDPDEFEVDWARAVDDAEAYEQADDENGG
jgi:hypothetical protein